MLTLVDSHGSAVPQNRAMMWTVTGNSSGSKPSFRIQRSQTKQEPVQKITCVVFVPSGLLHWSGKVYKECGTSHKHFHVQESAPCLSRQHQRVFQLCNTTDTFCKAHYTLQCAAINSEPPRLVAHVCRFHSSHHHNENSSAATPRLLIFANQVHHL